MGIDPLSVAQGMISGETEGGDTELSPESPPNWSNPHGGLEGIRGGNLKSGGFTGVDAQGGEYYDIYDQEKDLTQKDAFFRWEYLDPVAFVKNYTYDFVIWEYKNGTQEVKARIFLPIPPQRISVNTPVATSLMATMKGIVEDHNGAPFRKIVISGTSGVNWENNMSQEISGESKGVLDYMFKNTISAAKQFAGAASKALAAFAGGVPQPPNNPPVNNQIKKAPSTGDSGGFQDALLGAASTLQNLATGVSTESVDTPTGSVDTGYLFFHNLSRFFDYYIALKKTKRGRFVRLTFQMHKDKMFYDCTLNNFSFTKPPGSVEYLYNIQLTAYRRRPKPIGREMSQVSLYPPTKPAELNILAKVMNGLAATNAALLAAQNIFKGVKNDFYDIVIKPVKEAQMLLKNFIGVADAWSDLVHWAGSDVMAPYIAKSASVAGADRYSQYQYDRDVVLGFIEDDPFRHVEFTEEDLEVIDELSIEDGEVPDEILEAFEAYKAHIAAKTKPEWQVYRDEIVRFLAIAEVVLGLELVDEAEEGLQVIINDDGTVSVLGVDEAVEVDPETGEILNATTGGLIDPFGLGFDPDVISQLLAGAYDVETTVDSSEAGDGEEPGDATSPEMIDLITPVNNAAIHIDSLIAAYDTLFRQPSTDYAAFYKDYAVNNGISIVDNTSKFYVPFPLGATMQSLAVQYLGSADRWVEISSINGLQPPYIDEEGFKKYLTAPGSGNSITLADSTNLYIGQIVTIQASATETLPAIRPEAKKIETIETVDSTTFLITFGGDSDLAKFTVAGESFIHAYKPNTVNSKKLVAIPSLVPTSVPETEYRMAPNQEDLNLIEKIAKVDWLLTSEGDLALIGGDVKLSIGLQNILQAALIKLYTPLGSLVHDPSFGNPLFAGLSVADIKMPQLIRQLNQMFSKDVRFGSTNAARVRIRGPAAVVDLAVNIKGSSFYLPITTELPV